MPQQNRRSTRAAGKRSPARGPLPDAPAPQEAPARCSDTPDSPDAEFSDCPCTGRNLDKLTSPAAMLAIAEAETASGYAIAGRVQELPLSGETGVDHSAVYRALRKMEETGMVTSIWDTSGGGPARRLYTLTADGQRCLDTWAETLRRQSLAIEDFLEEHKALRSKERQR